MSIYEFLQVDAFTDQPLYGNPCAVLFETDSIDDDKLLAIAKEMNLSETAFVRYSESADFAVRYFTPAEEIPLAGHPTIATAHALVDTGKVKLVDTLTSIKLEMRVGIIQVDIHSQEGKPRIYTMRQQAPKFLSKHDPEEVMPIFGLSASDLLQDNPIQTVSTGTPQLMIPVQDLEALRRIEINLKSYSDLRTRGDFFSPHLFCLQGVTPVGKTFSRHFGVPPDTPEDPVTGSATGGMAAYLWHYGLINKPTFIAEQGHWMKRPGQIHVEVVGPRDNIRSINIGGHAVTTIRGELILDNQS